MQQQPAYKYTVTKDLRGSGPGPGDNRTVKEIVADANRAANEVQRLMAIKSAKAGVAAGGGATSGGIVDMVNAAKLLTALEGIGIDTSSLVDALVTLDPTEQIQELGQLIGTFLFNDDSSGDASMQDQPPVRPPSSMPVQMKPHDLEGKTGSGSGANPPRRPDANAGANPAKRPDAQRSRGASKAKAGGSQAPGPGSYEEAAAQLLGGWPGGPPKQPAVKAPVITQVPQRRASVLNSGMYEGD